jgi:hypothetical protein
MYYRAMGQCFMMGWEGTEVTPQIRTLIEDHHLGSILLTTKNLKCNYFSLTLLCLCSLSYSMEANPTMHGNLK